MALYSAMGFGQISLGAMVYQKVRRYENQRKRKNRNV